jgi:hypothetical protein
MTNRDPRTEAEAAFYEWHTRHRQFPYADMTRDLENAAGVTQDGFAMFSTEYWWAALRSARQSFADYAEGVGF